MKRVKQQAVAAQLDWLKTVSKIEKEAHFLAGFGPIRWPDCLPVIRNRIAICDGN